MNAEAAKKRPTRSPWIRIIAALLVVALVGNVILAQQAVVVLRVSEQETSSARAAAQQLFNSNDYVNASQVERMAAYLRSLLNGTGTYEEYELAAQIAVAQAKYQDAIGLTEKEIGLLSQDSPDLPGLYLRQGYLYTMLKDYASALTWLHRGITLDPAPEALLTRAQVYLNLGDTGLAMKDVEAYLTASGSEEAMLPYLVNVYEAAGDYETAADMYTRLMAANETAEYVLSRAYCLTQLGRMEEAQADRDRYVALGGEEKGAADVMVGVGWLRSGQYEAANACFVRALEENYSDRESLRYYIVLCAYISRDYARACEYGAGAVETIRSGKALSSAQVSQEASTGKLRVTLVTADAASLCLMTGNAYLYLGQYAEAKDCLDLYLSYDADDTYVRYLRGSCLLAMGEYGAAIPDFDAAVAAHEEEERSRYSRAICLMQAGKNDQALEDLNWVMLNGTDETIFPEAAKLAIDLSGETPQ